MSDYTDELIGIGSDESGAKRLSGASFVDQTFPELVLGPIQQIGQTFVVEDCRFERCTVEPGRFAIRPGVVLRNVVFNSVSSQDSLTISTNTVLDRVTICGNPRMGGVWVKPDEVFDTAQDNQLREWATRSWPTIDVMLDISKYWGPNVEILGLPAERVVFDPARHIVVKRTWNDVVDWTELGIGPRSYWRIRLMRIKSFDVDTGIYDLPTKKEGKYEEAMRDLMKLKECGLV